MNPETLITRSGNLIEAGVDEELFLLDIDGGHCFGFNTTATEIWQLIEQPVTLAALCDALAQTRDVDPVTCRTEIAALVQTLADEQLVALTPA